MTIVVQQNTNVPVIPEPNYGVGGLTFLQMVQRLRQESATSGAAPATTVNQIGDVKRLIDWVSTAWMDIQNQKKDWFFMRQPISFNTVAGQQSYTAQQANIQSFGNYKRDSFRQYSLALGFGSEQRLNFIPYDTFRDMYQYASMRTTSQLPVVFTIDPAKNFLLGPIPNDIYVVNGEGYAMPTEFINDNDRSTMPSQYHMAIVWRALMYYGQYEAASEAFSHGQNEYNRLMNRLLDDQMPEVMFGAPLA